MNPLAVLNRVLTTIDERFPGINFFLIAGVFAAFGMTWEALDRLLTHVDGEVINAEIRCQPGGNRCVRELSLRTNETQMLKASLHDYGLNQCVMPGDRVSKRRWDMNYVWNGKPRRQWTWSDNFLKPFLWPLGLFGIGWWWRARSMRRLP